MTKPVTMKKLLLPISTGILALLITVSCSHKNYLPSAVELEMERHKTIAILPAEMVFTGTQPKNITPEEISRIEETESLSFQNSLYNGIMRYANTKYYYTNVMVQDIVTTRRLLENNKIGVRDSWKEDDKKLAGILGVDAVVRMRIQKKRYMSDLASMGINMGQQVITAIGAASTLPVWYIPSKTNDIYASCNVVSNNKTLWNDNYKGAANYSNPSEDVINNITDNFGRHFPYRKQR
jgi:hypothetical protein